MCWCAVKKLLTHSLAHVEVGSTGMLLVWQGDEDSIPLHIMLLLMDEVFDLKSRNQWLRRRIVAILQQIAKTMFGDSINRSVGAKDVIYSMLEEA